METIKLFIFSFKDLTVAGGTPVRTLGHIMYLSRLGISVNFYSIYEPPEFLKQVLPSWHQIRIPRSLELLLRFYPLSFFFKPLFKAVISRYNLIQACASIDCPIIFHQNFLLGYFLQETYHKVCLFDIHGILDYQREYIVNATIQQKLLYYNDFLKEQQILRNARFLITPSLMMKLDLARRFKIDKKRIFVGEDGLLTSRKGHIDQKKRAELIAKFQISVENRYLLFIGNFKTFGGIIDLINAYLLLKQQGMPVKLIIVGSGQENHNVERIIKSHSLERDIFWVQYIPYEEIVTYHSIADILICPDRINKYNSLLPHIKLFDSLSAGKPIVFSYFRCLKTIISDISGFETFMPGNCTEMAEKIALILTHYDEYRQKALLNLKAIEKYSYENASKKLIRQLKRAFNV